MDIEEIQDRLRRVTKEALIYDFSRVLNLLTNIEDQPKSDFGRGWKSSLEAIVDICNLNKYF